MNVFQWEFPCASGDLTHFRKRIGSIGAEKILKHSIEMHGSDAHEMEVVVDSTVQEKNITFPTDVKLSRKIIARCRKIAKMESIELRQSYVRIEKQKARQRFRRRAGIEPIIGHLKSDHGMLRNYLKGAVGDDINILLAAATFNYKKKLKQLKSIFVFIKFWTENCLNEIKLVQFLLKIPNLKKIIPVWTC